MNKWPQLGLCAAVAFLSVGCPAFTGPPPPPVPVTTVRVQPSNPTLEAGFDSQLTATPLGPSGEVLTGRVVTWSSSNETVATVSGNGHVTAISPGLVTIVATAEGKSGQASVRVVVPQVTNVDVKPSSFSLVGGDRRRLEATARSSQGLPVSGCTFSFVSANPAVATVEPDGTVIAQTPGNVAINVVASCGEAGTGAGSASVEVLEPRIGLLTPLTDAPAHSYKGQLLGLFDGRNSPPPAHDAAGIASGAAVRPIGGKIVFISIGMSNASQEFDTWRRGHESAGRGAWRNDDVWLVNCASGGGTVEEWDDAGEEMYERCRDRELAPDGLTEADVQIVWGKLVSAELGVALPDPDADAWRLADSCGDVIAALRSRYPNLKQVFLSSRTYGGFATASSPEPFAYENAFGIRRCIVNNATSTFVSWGPYLWASESPRIDGLFYTRADFATDGLHPSTSGEVKVAQLLEAFFDGSSYTPWWPR